MIFTHNYFNIFPTAGLVILVLFFILGLIFYVALYPYAESAISSELISYGNTVNKQVFGDNSIQLVNNFVLNLKNELKESIYILISDEKSNNKSNNTKSILTYTFTVIGLLLAVSIYFYVMKYVLHYNVDLLESIITFGIITITIILFLLLFLFTIIMKRQTNKDKVLYIALEYFFN